MYDGLKRLVSRLLRVEDRKPEPLPGHGGAPIQVLRAAPSYLCYRLFFWKLYAFA